MLVRDALVAYAHFLAIFALACVLVGEALLLRRTLPAGTFRRLLAVDRWYGIIAGLVIVTGLLRLFTSPKGVAFYSGNAVFWAKISLFVIVGLISIVPTVAYLRWEKRTEPDGSLALEEAEYERIRGLVYLQIGIFVFIPLCATFMARGI
ncbi:MAG TPA: DUF2214 family protein [Candidatus Sulfotelmatobacter sp.]|nr:DUF2214 family protein [Candidatus Sulfotelmatobacter sp.]